MATKSKQDHSTKVDEEARRMKTYTVRMIAKDLSLVEQTIRNRLEELKLKPNGKVCLKGRKGRPTLTFSKAVVDQLRAYGKTTQAVWVSL